MSGVLSDAGEESDAQSVDNWIFGNDPYADDKSEAGSVDYESEARSEDDFWAGNGPDAGLLSTETLSVGRIEEGGGEFKDSQDHNKLGGESQYSEHEGKGAIVGNEGIGGSQQGATGEDGAIEIDQEDDPRMSLLEAHGIRASLYKACGDHKHLKPVKDFLDGWMNRQLGVPVIENEFES